MFPLAVLAALLAQTPQPPAAPAPPDDDFKIVDNSFLVEEAFNQEPRIYQNIFNWTRQNGDWIFTFTQEWPVPGIRHQLSYTIPVASLGGVTGVGDVLANYRYQVLEEGPGRPAVAPRISAVLPTASAKFGGGNYGVQVDLPFSKRHGDVYYHWNVGFTSVKTATTPDLTSPFLAASAVYRLRPMINLMLESVMSFDEIVSDAGDLTRSKSVTLAPGVRGGWNIAEEKQIVVGAAVPITWNDGRTAAGAFVYFSYELPFKKPARH